MTDGVGFGGDFGDGGLGRTRVGNGGDQVAGDVKNIVKQIEAGFWHAHIVGTEVVGTEVVGIGGVVIIDSKEQMFMDMLNRFIMNVKFVIHHR